MNLDSCTPGQREIITTLDKPLMVSAGAGSGKTFTLTQRIAYALESRTDQPAPFVTSIDEVVAITFTKKAAAELKSRVKHRLLEMGLAEEALKVDDAWISTIHGMCSRILREHALELGIDPAFEVISETESQRCRAQAFDEAVQAIMASDNTTLTRFIREVGIRSTSNNTPSIESFVDAITARAQVLPGGFDAVVYPHTEADPAALMREMVELGEEFIACMDSMKTVTKTDVKHRDAMADALDAVHAYLENTPAHAFDAPAFDAERFAAAFFAFPKTSPKYRSKDSDPTFFAEYRSAYSALAAEAEAGMSVRELRAIVETACSVEASYQRIKGSARLDNNDLLRRAYLALEENPCIAQAYRDHFKLIMIDEFQDTDELQVALISRIAKPGLTNVCTVGDAQQSIYRFRGADVNVFYGYRENLEQNTSEPRFVNLPDNFRSHADVLSFVDAIFSQNSVFGSRFLSLAPKGAINKQPDTLFASRPRINMALYDCRLGGGGTEQGRTECAQRIAQHFAELREAGASPADMVVLLGTMKHVDTYSQALREAGFECLVAGGSTFSDAYEVSVVEAVLRYFANQLDDEALYQVLASPLFALSEDTLLHLSTNVDRKGRTHRRPLSQGLLMVPREQGLTCLGPDDADKLDFAYRTLASAHRVLETQGLSAALNHLVSASGWLLRLEADGAQGLAAAGNIHKAARMVAEIETQGLGLARSVNQFCQDVATLKLAPGTLSTTSSNFVRIMTVHASKGLEFAHVALADVRLSPRVDDFVAENIEGNAYLALRPLSAQRQRSVATALRDYAEPSNGTAEEVLKAKTAGQRSRALEEYVASQELSEAHRLLYVALTRAVKSLFVGIVHRGNVDFSYEGKGILEDLYTALQWETRASATEQALNYGGSAPLHFELHVLDKRPDAEEVFQVPRSTFAIPARPAATSPFAQPYRPVHDEVFSYSSISHDVLDEATTQGSLNAGTGAPESDAGWGSGAEADLNIFGESSFFENLEVAPEEDATALGTAFHRLAQLTIESYTQMLVSPSEEAIQAQIQQNNLSHGQAQRLRKALATWFASDVCAELTQTGKPRAEVPFMVALQTPAGEIYLEGEIDAVSFAPDKSAYLVDYKTGGTDDETSDAIEDKHKMQAQCYALALLRQGCPKVEATFVRVERRNQANPTQPQVQSYVFTQDDLPMLENIIVQAYAS